MKHSSRIAIFTTIVALAPFSHVSQAAAERECRPAPVYLNVDYAGSAGDAFLYLSPDRDFELHRWGKAERMKPFSRIVQHVTQNRSSNHGLLGRSIQLTPKANSSIDYFDFPAVRIALSKDYEQSCLYGPTGRPTDSVTLTIPRQYNPQCRTPRVIRTRGKRTYRSAIIKGCTGRMDYGAPGASEENIDLGTLALRFSDGFMLYRQFFLPGALTSINGSVINGQIVGGGISFKELLDSTGAYVYSVSINMPVQREKDVR
ncbi:MULTISPECIES: hypothetical protein [Alphaproteobacteria]|uniref:hypothetical protein n=1 Tax=Alphaproteobacteria TaxID=28211 RepID=UPI00326755E5